MNDVWVDVNEMSMLSCVHLVVSVTPMTPQTRIVVAAIANGLCGAAVAVAALLRLVSIGIAVAIAIAVMAATWVLLRRAILDKQALDRDTQQGPR
jgi:hypothetical protein